MITKIRPGQAACGKLVILVDVFRRGRAEKQACLLARELRQTYGIEAEIWALWGEPLGGAIPGRVIGFRRPTKAPTSFLRGVQWGSELWRVVRVLRQAKVDVLLPFAPWANVVGGLAYRLAGARLCIWGERHAGGERVSPTPERIAAARYRRFVANSTAGVEFLIAQLRIARERISLIPSAVEPLAAPGATDWRARLRLGSAEPIVAMVGNLDTGCRDLPTLLRAWAIVQQNWTSGARPFLALAGSRPYYDDDYQSGLSIRRKEDLDTSLRFVDFTDDVSALIDSSDLAVFSSRLEGMPDGILECMAFGKAVVATDLPGIRDALGENAGEVLVRTGDADQLAHVVLNLLRNKSKRDALGAANQARARTEFTVHRMAERHFRLIVDSLPDATVSARQNTDIAQNRAHA